MPKDKESSSKSGSPSWDPDEIPGDSTYLYKQNRWREPWEFRGAPKPVAREVYEDLEKDYERLSHSNSNLEDSFDELEQDKNDLEYERDDLLKQFEELSRQWRIYQTKHNTIQKQSQDQVDRSASIAKAYQEAGQLAIDLLIEYGDHTIECNIWDLRRSGRILTNEDESSTCSCGWSKTGGFVTEAREKGKSGQLTYEEVESILKKYK